MVGEESSDALADGTGQLEVGALVAGYFARFTRVEVVLTGLALHHFTSLGNGDALGGGFMSLKGHKCIGNRMGEVYVIS